MPQHADRTFLNDVYPDGLTWDSTLPRTDLVRLIDWACAEFADRPFMNFKGRQTTYRQAGEMIDAAAASLQDMGVQPGKKVGLHMANTPYFPIMFFAILKAGGTVVNLSPLDSQSEMEDKVKDSGAEIVVTLDLKSHYDKNHVMLKKGMLKNVVVCPLSEQLPLGASLMLPLLSRAAPVINLVLSLVGMVAPDRAKAIRATLDETAIARHYRHEDAVVSYTKMTFMLRQPAPVCHAPDDLAVLQYTGGTTGVPKGAMLSHFNLMANVHQIEHFFRATPAAPADARTLSAGKERFLAALPFFHIFGLMSNMLNCVRFGGEMVIVANPRNIEDVLQTIHHTRPTIFPTVPRLLQAISERADLADYDLSSLRAVMTGGAALPLGVRDAFEKAVGRPGLVMQGYGMTETSPVLTSNPPYGDNRAETVGLPYPNTEIRIADPDQPDTLSKDGEIGEIQVRAPQVMRGYYNRPDETAAMFVDGWLRTGDLGFIDAQGYVHIVDRLKDLVLVNGFNVYPSRIESVVSQFPGIAECAVIGVKKGSVDESAKLFIRMLDPAAKPDEHALRQFMKAQMSAYEVPRYIEFWSDELPKTTIGKPDRKALEKREKERESPAVPAPKP